MLTPIIKNKFYTCPHCGNNLIHFTASEMENMSSSPLFKSTENYEYEEDEDLKIYISREDFIKKNNALDLIYILSGQCEHCHGDLYSAQHLFSLVYRGYFLQKFIDFESKNTVDQPVTYCELQNDLVLGYKDESSLGRTEKLFKLYHNIYANKDDLIYEILEYSSTLFLTAKSFDSEIKILNSFNETKLNQQIVSNIKANTSQSDDAISNSAMGISAVDLNGNLTELPVSNLSDIYQELLIFLLNNPSVEVSYSEDNESNPIFYFKYKLAELPTRCIQYILGKYPTHSGEYNVYISINNEREVLTE